MTPTVSVIVPTRNREAFLTGCLAAALDQEGVAVEVIVVDDASTDGTRKLLGSVRDERVRVVHLAQRKGVAGARNVGIAAARGEWLAFLDDDDIWAPWKLSLQLDAARSASTDIAYGAAVVIDKEHEVVGYSPAPPTTGLCEALLVRNVIPGGCSNVIAKTALVREIGAFDERLSQLADRDLWIRLTDMAESARCSEVVVAYLLHPGNMRHQRGADGVAEFEYLLEKHEAAQARRGVTASRRIGYHYFARAQLRAGHRFGAAKVFTRLAVRERSVSQLGQAAAAVVLGRGVRDTFPKLMPRGPGKRHGDADWVAARSPMELGWVESLRRGAGPDGEVVAATARVGDSSVFGVLNRPRQG